MYHGNGESNTGADINRPLQADIMLEKLRCTELGSPAMGDVAVRGNSPSIKASSFAQAASLALIANIPTEMKSGAVILGKKVVLRSKGSPQSGEIRAVGRDKEK
ncbi:hypothetical protein PIB30_006399 [Stylosanthes scabra]|uniref:Uncharacterized protein n=1 Tax=Stylosanthes scabra TaxID=79078 RepID=A0ABU6T421_9FABA|nr:hypothetical protein [Stylosanthes scabra]